MISKRGLAAAVLLAMLLQYGAGCAGPAKKPATPAPAVTPEEVGSMMRSTPGQDALRDSMAAMMTNPAVLTGMTKAMQTPEMRTALAQAMQTPEMRRAMASLMSTPEMRRVLIDTLSTPEMRQVLAEIVRGQISVKTPAAAGGTTGTQANTAPAEKPETKQ